MMCTGSMCIDIIYLRRFDPAFFHCKFHCFGCSASVFCRRSNVICISRRTVSDKFGIDDCTTLFCMFQFFQNNYTCTFSENESIPVFIKWSGCLHRICRSRKCCQTCESCDSGLTDTSFCSTRQHHFCVTILDRTECITDAVCSTGTCCDNIRAFSFQPKLDGNIACCHVRDHHRNQQWIDSSRSFGPDLFIFFFYCLKASDTGTYDHTDTERIFF